MQPFRTFSVAALALVLALPLGAQIVGQQQNTSANAASAGAGASSPPVVSSAAQLQANIDFVLGKWDELQAESHGGEAYISEALEHYRAAMKANPGSAFLATQLADLLSRLGRTQPALTLAQQTVAQHPDSVVAHKVLGEIYLRQLSNAPQPISDASSGGAMTAAIADYKELIGLEPHSADDVVILGKLYGAEGKPAEAEQQFRAALALQPTNMDALASLVQSLANQNRLDEARQEIAALPEVAQSAQVYATLGDAYASRHRYADAAQAYQQAVQADPDNGELKKAWAHALMDAGEYTPALAAYQQLHQQLPEDGSVALRLGQLQMQMGQLSEARTSLEEASKLLPEGDLELAYATALLDQSQGHETSALHELQALVNRNTAPTTQSIFLAQLARLEMRLGEDQQAGASLEQMQRLGPAYRSRALHLEVELYAGQRHYAQALSAAQALLAAEPDARGLHFTYADLLAASGKEQAAAASLKPLLHGTARDWDVYLALGQVAMKQQEWKQALADTHKANALASTSADHARAASQMGAIQAKQMRFAAAERSYHQALQLEPNDADTLNALGYLLAEQGVRLPEALGYVQQALAQDAYNSAYLDSQGWIYYKMNRLPQAVSSLERAARYDRYDPAILDHLAQAYEGDGKLQEAATSWAQALAELKLNPDRGAARQQQEMQKKLEAVKVRLAEEGQGQ
ncbi:MAG: tetratricopeptide repeat protein [Terriglobales bacterium]